MKEILKKLRKYEIQIRKAVNSQMNGEFRSVFKGTGLEFDDVRQYQYGDDVRSINWNVSAKGHGAYINTFKEEKDQSVFFIVDVSGSQNIGRPGQQKLDFTKEVTGVLALAASNTGSQVGLICFSDQKEKYIKPDKGPRHATQLITELYKLKPKSQKTSVATGIAQALGIIKKRSVVFLISDFVDEGYEKNLKALAKHHDVIVIQVYDPRESKFPKLGIVPVKDKESGRTIWVNTSMPSFRNKTSKLLKQTITGLESVCKKHEIDFLTLDTSQDYADKLIKIFKRRNATYKRG